MGLTLEYPPGSTPLDPNETEGLIPQHIYTQSQLNEWEAENILRGKNWALSRKRKRVLSDAFLRKLHSEMFNDTWIWAGKYRTTVKTIGIFPEGISVKVRDVMADIAYLAEHQTCSLQEIAIRLHHGLVVAHPFPNGNGRVTRFVADYFLWTKGQPMFTWGAGADLTPDSQSRMRYISALRAADKGDIKPLLEFATS